MSRQVLSKIAYTFAALSLQLCWLTSSHAAGALTLAYVRGYGVDAAKLTGALDSLSTLELKEVTSGAAALQLLAAASVQGVADSGVIPMAIAAQQGVDYRIVYVEDNIANA